MAPPTDFDRAGAIDKVVAELTLLAELAPKGRNNDPLARELGGDRQGRHDDRHPASWRDVSATTICSNTS